MGAATTERLDRPLTARLAGLLIARLMQPALDNIIDQVENMGRQFHQRLVALEAERDRLQARVADLEQRQAESLVYCGIWRGGEVYAPGSIVTHSGTVWHAWAATGERPGTTSDWMMMAKTR